MLNLIIIIIVLAIVVLLGYAATKPDTFNIQRTSRIKATPEKIFPHINDLKAWRAWSPYEKLDTEMRKTLKGADSGVGSVYEWEGNSKAGVGRVEIIESIAPSKIVMKLDMLKPFQAHNIIEFSFKEKDSYTDVTWSMHGSQPYLAKVMGVIFNCDKIVGSQFEEGFTKLRSIVEK